MLCLLYQYAGRGGEIRTPDHVHPSKPTPGSPPSHLANTGQGGNPGAGDPGRAPEARAFNQAKPLPESLVARHGIEPCPPAFQTSTLPSSSRAKIWWTVRDSNSHCTGAGRG